MSLATGISPLDLLDPRFDVAAELEEELAERLGPYHLLALIAHTTHEHYRAYLQAHGVKPSQVPPSLDVLPIAEPDAAAEPPRRVSIKELAAIAGRDVTRGG